MKGGVLRRLGRLRLVSRDRLRQAEARADEANRRLQGIERLLARIQRDVERVKLHTSVVVQPDRAISLLATGDRIYVDPRDRGSGVNLLTEGKYEEDELRVFRSFLRPGAVVLDIGANYGYYSIVAALQLRPGGRVIGFEPNPHVHDLYCASIYVNGIGDIVEARRLAVSDAAGTVAFEIDETGPGGARIIARGDRPFSGNLVIDVPTVRLDEHLPADMIVDVVKIDVEGHEEHVLNGMRAVIARSPAIAIFMEFIFGLFPSEEAAARIVRLITVELGLRMYRILPQGHTIEVDLESLRGSACNLVLTRAALGPRPDLTLLPVQLIRGAGVELIDGALSWQRPPDEPDGFRVLLHGPYVYMPRGTYRLVVDADFTGEFLCQVQENFGDLLWEERVSTGSGLSAVVVLPFDAPRLEIVVRAVSAESVGLRFRSAEFWLIG